MHAAKRGIDTTRTCRHLPLPVKQTQALFCKQQLALAGAGRRWQALTTSLLPSTALRPTPAPAHPTFPPTHKYTHTSANTKRAPCLQDLETVGGRRTTHVDGAVKAARPQQRVVQRVGTVGGSHHEHLRWTHRGAAQYDFVFGKKIELPELLFEYETEGVGLRSTASKPPWPAHKLASPGCVWAAGEQG